MIIATADGITATRPFFAYGGGGGPQWHVYMLIDNNSLTMYPLDTVSTTFSVLVTNEYHGNEPGVKVNLTLANPLLGYIEFTDPLRRDTTDMFGQVHGVYHTWAAGCNNVVAEVEGFSDAAEVCTQPLEIGSVEVYIYEPYLIFDEGDSSEAQVVAYVWAPDNRFLSGVRVQMSVTDQQWGVLLPFSSGQSDRTDSEGRIRMMYSTFAEGCNHIIFQAGGLSDSVEICSYERLYAVGEIVVENPDLRHFPGDSVETAVTIFMRDRQNAPLPDIELEIELHSLSGLIEYVNPEQGNVTDAAGRVDLRVRSAADECGYISANYMEGWVDGREICVYEYNPEIRLYTIPGEIHFPEEDSVMLRLELTDDDFGAYQDSVLSVWISGGELAHNPLPPTNIEGGSSTWWRFNGASGYFQAAVNFYGFTDTTTIYVP
jgi:hypothetical protein